MVWTNWREARILRRSGGRLGPEKECPEWADWRGERFCRQTLSSAFSMGYEPHRLLWMLPGESRTAAAVSIRLAGGADARPAERPSIPDLGQGGNTNVVVRRTP